MDPEDTLEKQREEVARAKRRMLIAARGEQPKLSGTVNGVRPRLQGSLPALVELAVRNPGATASVAAAVVCVLGVGGTLTIANRAIKLAGLFVTARKLLKV